MKKQINKEVIVTILIYFVYFLWWYYFAYIYPPKEVKNYTYILGFPAWFFYSCILGYILVNVLIYISIKLFFKNVDLETGDVNE